MALAVREVEKVDWSIIAGVNREETIRAYYVARPSKDGRGLVLETAEFGPPRELSRWDADDVEERIGWWAPELEKGGAFVGAFDGERLAGFAVVGHIHADGSGELSAIFVDKDYRGRGIGSALMHAAEENAAKRGARAVYIMSVPTATTVDFYMRHGYGVIAAADKSLISHLPLDIILAKKL